METHSALIYHLCDSIDDLLDNLNDTKYDNAKPELLTKNSKVIEENVESKNFSLCYIVKLEDQRRSDRYEIFC